MLLLNVESIYFNKNTSTEEVPEARWFRMSSEQPKRHLDKVANTCIVAAFANSQISAVLHQQAMTKLLSQGGVESDVMSASPKMSQG